MARPHRPTLGALSLAVATLAAMDACGDENDRAREAWDRIAPYFRVPAGLALDDAAYRSPLRFDDGSAVSGPTDWPRRRREILAYWHTVLGAWPEVIEEPRVETLESADRGEFTEHRVRFKITPVKDTEAFLLVPESAEPGEGKRPAVLVVYYDPDTGVGRGKAHRDYALQLARRGFVTLSMGHPASLYHPSQDDAALQPLSALAYAAANAYHVLASRQEVDPERVGIVGHSYGAKWAMFTACLYDKFACAAWSDGGIVFDETRPNVNYWEPWYLGWEKGKTRRPGVPAAGNPRTGAYRKLREEGRDLHELHALMAPRPFLVSGGTEDRPERWSALHHAVAVNRLLGFEDRVAMTSRPHHDPDAESNEVVYLFFEHFLRHGGRSGWRAVANAVGSVPSETTVGPRHVLDRAEAKAGALLSRLEHPRSAESLREAAPHLRGALRRAVGLDQLPLPSSRAVESVGVLDRGDHVIEKLVWETFPGVRVPAHVYRPARATGRLPAVLHVPGHWWEDSKSREHFQALDINLARLGFVVLTYDPVGQGERGVSFRDHRRTESLLVGVSQLGIALHESRCALEVLRAREDIDPERIAITGASGGGYTTWWMTALDERIACAVPVVGTSEFLEQVRACRPLDWYHAEEHCHFVPGLLRFANNHELLALAAPRPVLVVAAAEDESFPVRGVREVVAYGEHLYAALGSPERLEYFEDPADGHGYQKRKREAAYGFLRRWLQGDGDGRPLPEPPTETLGHASPELRCFPQGHNQPAGPGISAWIRTRTESPDPARRPLDPPALREELSAVLGIEAADLQRSRGPLELELMDASVVAGVKVQQASLRSFDGLRVPAVLLVPLAGADAGLVAVADAGMRVAAAAAAIETAVRSEFAVLLVDPRGLGELAVKESGWLFALNLLCGTSLLGEQARDLAAARSALAALPDLQGKPIGLHGAGETASLAALYAAVFDPAFAWLVTDGGFLSYRDFVERPQSLAESFTLARTREGAWDGIDEEIPHALFAFDVLRRFDLPDLYGALAPRRTLVVRPIDGDRRQRTAEDARSVLARGNVREGGRGPASVPHIAAGAGAESALGAFLQAQKSD